ncbi:unnamed protein product [Boreogadus saida]
MGSNTGIGKKTAITLAKRGARVILACRSQQRGEIALAEVIEESRSKEVVFMQLDIGSLKSVRTFAENFLKIEDGLDLLINNAGILLQATPTPTPSHSPLHSAYAKCQRRKALDLDLGLDLDLELDLNPDLGLDLDLVLPIFEAPLSNTMDST